MFDRALAIFSETILSMTLVFSQEHEQLLPILCLVCLTLEEIEEALVLPFTDLTDEFLLERLDFMPVGCSLISAILVC